MSDIDLDSKTERAIQGVATSAEHLERLTYFLSRLFRHPDCDVDSTELASALQKIDRAIESLRSCTQQEEREVVVTTRCAQHMLEQIGSSEPAPEPTRKCVLSGTGPEVEIPELLELLSCHRKTGTLRVKTADEMFTLEISSGDVIHAVSDSPPDEARLGNILIARGAVDAATLDKFFAEYGTSSGRMGEALKSGKIVTEAQLRDALEHQVQELFHRMFSAAENKFWFYAGETDTPEHHVRMNVVHLLLESARSLDEGSSVSPTTDDPDA